MIEFGPTDRPAGIDNIEGLEAPSMSPMDRISFLVLDNIRLAATETDDNPVQNYVTLTLEEVPRHIWMYKTTDKEGHSLLGIDVAPTHTQFRGPNTLKEKYKWSVDTPEIRQALIGADSLGAIALAALKNKFAEKFKRRNAQKFTPKQIDRLSLIMFVVNSVTGQPQWESSEASDD